MIAIPEDNITDGGKLLEAIEELGAYRMEAPKPEEIFQHQAMTMKDSKGKDQPIDVTTVDIDEAVNVGKLDDETESDSTPPQETDDDTDDREKFLKDLGDDAAYYRRQYGTDPDMMQIQRESMDMDLDLEDSVAQIESKESEDEVLLGDDLPPELKAKSKIARYFTKDELKAIFCFALSIKIYDNNVKAQVLSDYMAKKGFVALGTGTNRIAFKKGSYVYKLPLDRRGIVDNLMEFLRAPQAPQFLAHTYECCGAVIVSEYLDVIDLDTHIAQKEVILQVLNELGKEFIIGDMGYDAKNFMNFGVRKHHGARSFVFLDYAYMHTRLGNEEAFTCPRCGAPLRYNETFTQYVCSNRACNTKLDYRQILWRINSNWDNPENSLMAKIRDMSLANLGMQVDI